MKMHWKDGAWVPRRQQKKQALDFKPKEGRYWDWHGRQQYDNYLYALTKSELEALEAELYQYWTWDNSSKEIEDKWELVKQHLANLDGHSMGDVRWTSSTGPR